MFRRICREPAFPWGQRYLALQYEPIPAGDPQPHQGQERFHERHQMLQRIHNTWRRHQEGDDRILDNAEQLHFPYMEDKAPSRQSDGGLGKV